MPVDMAVGICLASPPPVHAFIAKNCCSSSATLLRRREPLQPCLSPGSNIAMATSTPPASLTSAPTAADVGSSLWYPRNKKKKTVVFADSRGLELTAVHVFKEFEDHPLSGIGGATPTSPVGESTEASDHGSVLVLDFDPPALDYLDLRNRLNAQQVCLETCALQERELWGTVQVRNLCFEKSVSLRITFDSWSCFQDVPCQYLNNVYSSPDTDTFSFSILVPEILDPSNKVEFCIRYQTPDSNFWDNNHGNNYKLLMTDLSSNLTKNSDPGPAKLDVKTDCGGEKRNELEFDVLRSPRTSAGIFPDWQGWRCVETGAPYW